jgi:hypothetical protein
VCCAIVGLTALRGCTITITPPGNDNSPNDNGGGGNGNANDNTGGNANDNSPGGGNDNSVGNANDNDGEPPILVELRTITFLGDVPSGVDPASLSIGGGTVRFSGGVGGVVFSQPLAGGFVDDFAWQMTVGGTATVTFDDLDVRAVAFYLADLGSPGVTLTAEDDEGAAVDQVNSATAALRNDPRAQFEIDAGDRSIRRLVINVPNGVTASLDEVTLTVAESP